MQCWRFRTTRYDGISTDWIQPRLHAFTFDNRSSTASCISVIHIKFVTPTTLSWQEMLLDGARDESITVEILEHVGDVQDDGSARWFLEDLAADQGTVLTGVSHRSDV